MLVMIPWILIQVTPVINRVETFPTHGACVQAKQDMTNMSRQASYGPVTFICRQDIPILPVAVHR